MAEGSYPKVDNITILQEGVKKQNGRTKSQQANETTWRLSPGHQVIAVSQFPH